MPQVPKNSCSYGRRATSVIWFQNTAFRSIQPKLVQKVSFKKITEKTAPCYLGAFILFCVIWSSVNLNPFSACYAGWWCVFVVTNCAIAAVSVSNVSKNIYATLLEGTSVSTDKFFRSNY